MIVVDRKRITGLKTQLGGFKLKTENLSRIKIRNCQKRFLRISTEKVRGKNKKTTLFYFSDLY